MIELVRKSYVLCSPSISSHQCAPSLKVTLQPLHPGGDLFSGKLGGCPCVYGLELTSKNYVICHILYTLFMCVFIMFRCFAVDFILSALFAYIILTFVQ